jgi:ATP-dependent DNA helicase RecG
MISMLPNDRCAANANNRDEGRGRRLLRAEVTDKRLKQAADLPFDLQPLPSASLDDLDVDLFERGYLPNAVAPEVLTENRRSVEDQLQAVRFLDRHSVPTVVGILVVGQDPRAFVPGDVVQFVRFDGTELTDPVKDQKEIDGPIPELLRRLDEVIESHNSVGLELGGGPTAVQRPEYPLPALRQLIRNAVLHRDYESTHAPVRIYWFEDRVEIHSPGGPFGLVTPESFGEPGIADYRNPHLAEAMKVLGYVEKFGAGIQIARRELERNGNPPLEFTVQPTRVLAVVRRAS